jgi:hypothetical protein
MIRKHLEENKEVIKVEYPNGHLIIMLLKNAGGKERKIS